MAEEINTISTYNDDNIVHLDDREHIRRRPGMYIGKNPNLRNVHFIKIAVSFPSLIPCLIPPTDDRENTERRAKLYRAVPLRNQHFF